MLQRELRLRPLDNFKIDLATVSAAVALLFRVRLDSVLAQVTALQPQNLYFCTSKESELRSDSVLAQVTVLQPQHLYFCNSKESELRSVFGAGVCVRLQR